MMKPIISLSALLTVAACTPITPGSDNEKVLYSSMNVRQNLIQAAESDEDSLRTLAEAQHSKKANLINTNPLVTAQGCMGGRINLDWSGPIEPLLNKIATMTEYQVKVLGNKPAIPVLISITARDRMVADIIKDTGLQAGTRADLVVYPLSRVIELRYATA